MKSIPQTLLLPLLLCLFWGVFSENVLAQVRTENVSVQINVSEYDVMFLSDFFDVKADKLSSLASGFSVDLTLVNDPHVNGPGAAVLNACLYVNVAVNLLGENPSSGSNTLVEGYSQNFEIRDTRTLTVRDFAKGGLASPVADRVLYKENLALKKRIKDLALTTSTVPPGTYTIMIAVLPASARTTSVILGKDSKTITIAYSSPKQALVEMNEPITGSFFSNLTPTFSWTTAVPNVIVRVYEAGLNHRSPQDARTGSNICLEIPVKGSTVLTYPSTARRPLQENRAYVVQVEASVATSRGNQGNLSQPVVFRISDDHLGKMIDNFMNTLPGNLSEPYTALRAEPSSWIAWPLYGNATLDHGMISESDLQKVLNDLAARQDVKIEMSIENQ